MSQKPQSDVPQEHLLDPSRLRWRCPSDVFGFETTADLEKCPINIIGQPRALEALELGLASPGPGYNIFVSGQVGSGRSTVVRHMLQALEHEGSAPEDVVYVHNFEDADRPCRLNFPAGEGKRFRALMDELIDSLVRDLPKLFESELYRQRRAERIETASADQKARLKEFEKRVQAEGFTLAQVQLGPYVRSQLVPLVAGNPVEMDQLEALVEQEQFKREEFDEIREKFGKLKGELEVLSREVRNLDRKLRRTLAELDREVARPTVVDALAEIQEEFDVDKLERYLEGVGKHILEHVEAFQDGEEPATPEAASKTGPELPRELYAVNVLVDNSQTRGRPVIWERAPSYRNVFGTIEKTRTRTGDWETDHTKIKPGSLLRANGGILVLDALDVLVEPGVWAALKRTLRNREVEIQSFDPLNVFSSTSLTPEPVPIQVKVVMIGTHHIFQLLYALDEDFKKIFKVKAEFARQTPLNDEELMNFACLIHKRCKDDELPPFHRDAVAGIVEHGVRLAGSQDKLTTRFGEITDIVREAGYWASRAESDVTRVEDVDKALRHRVYRVDLIEERLRERIADGEVLLDLEGSKVAQVNGLAVLDVGDYVFGQPSRITATTAMGRAGIIDIDREAAMSGGIHTKGVLTLTGFLRERFAQRKPLTLTASLSFEQNYGGVDGDSASSAELYALLSSLADMPIRQGIAVTGSVNQRGEVQPIGGVNEKIEGYFDVCRLIGLNGEQGVMIPTRNLPQLMLRKDIVEEVARGRFHVWAVSTIEEGLEVLAGAHAGRRSNDGRYDAETIFGRVDAKLTRLAEEVTHYGQADAPGA